MTLAMLAQRDPAAAGAASKPAVPSRRSIADTDGGATPSRAATSEVETGGALKLSRYMARRYFPIASECAASQHKDPRPATAAIMRPILTRLEDVSSLTIRHI